MMAYCGYKTVTVCAKNMREGGGDPISLFSNIYFIENTKAYRRSVEAGRGPN